MNGTNNRFQRGGHGTGWGSAVYACRGCDKKTRETGHDESSVQLCARCYLIACDENSISDGGRRPEDIEEFRTKWGIDPG